MIQLSIFLVAFALCMCIGEGIRVLINKKRNKWKSRI